MWSRFLRYHIYFFLTILVVSIASNIHQYLLYKRATTMLLECQNTYETLQILDQYIENTYRD